jgi:hypothetical protein
MPDPHAKTGAILIEQTRRRFMQITSSRSGLTDRA